jgi:hypothetical protein
MLSVPFFGLAGEALFDPFLALMLSTAIAFVGTAPFYRIVLKGKRNI